MQKLTLSQIKVSINSAKLFEQWMETQQTAAKRKRTIHRLKAGWYLYWNANTDTMYEIDHVTRNDDAGWTGWQIRIVGNWDPFLMYDPLPTLWDAKYALGLFSTE